MRVAILTISDRSARGERADASGPLLARMVEGRGWLVSAQGVVSDDEEEIVATLSAWADNDRADVILTTGGTGFSPRDRAPEATLRVVERLAPGLAEAMRSASVAKTPHAMLSRAVAGLRGKVLIVNLPGSPKAARENLEVIIPALPHAVQLLRGDPDAEAGHSYQPSQRKI
jgi:molybdenum cofactor synthesis domain-containing protein